MYMNTNIDALKALRSLGVNGRKDAKTSEKLASGLRINRSADDVADLAISTKMRAQIRGLRQNERNIDDGISMFNTAEGGMSQIENIVQRIRELAVQSANDSNTDADRQYLQREVEQLIEQIDDVANYTEFNTMKVLMGQLETTTTTVQVSAYRSNQTLTVAASTLQAVALRNNNTQMSTSFTVNGTTIQLGPNFTSYPAVNGFDSYLLQSYSSLSGGGNFQTFSAGMYGSGNTVSDADGQLFIDTIAGAINLAVADYNAYSGASLPTTVKGVYITEPSDPDYGRVGLYIGGGNTGTIVWGGCSGTYSQYRNIGHDYLHMSFSGGGMMNVTETIVSNTYIPSEYYIHTGANTNQNVLFEIPPMMAEMVGKPSITNANVSTQTSANGTIFVCDQALKYVSEARTQMGATVNRLEHSKANVTNYFGNISAAESRMRDADMAKEMTEKVKGSILMQSAVAMLAHANQRPETMLELLR